MGSVLDVFGGDAFGVVEMTKAVNLLPYNPSRLGQLGLFKSNPIRSTVAMIERQGNKLALIPSTTRGAGGAKNPSRKRDARGIPVPHLPQNDTVLADSVQDVRAFDSDNRLESVSEVVSQKQTQMIQNHEVTEEFLRIGAIQGQVIDGDGTTVLVDLFSEFNVAEVSIDLDLTDQAIETKVWCMNVRRAIEDALGGTVFSGIRGFCGNGFWDNFITHDSVKTAFDRWQSGNFFRQDQRVSGGFEYCNIFFENYRGSVGNQLFIPDDVCRFVVEGVDGLFQTHYAPADYVETVNTMGQRFYSKQERMPFDRGVELETQSNPLPICNRPNTLIKSTSPLAAVFFDGGKVAKGAPVKKDTPKQTGK